MLGKNGGTIGHKAGTTLPQGGIRRAIRQACDMQAVLLRSINHPKTTPSAQAQCARAWRDLQEQVMELRGIGKPKPVQAKNDSTSTRARKPSGPPSPIGPSE